jgi:hypothetical protein
MLGKPVGVFFCISGQRHAALQHIRSQARSIRGQKMETRNQ